MNNIMVLVIAGLIVIAVIGCSSTQDKTCSIINDYGSTVFANQVVHLDSLISSDSCVFLLRSGYLDDVVERYFYFDGDCGYVKLSKKMAEYQKFFCISSKNTERLEVDITHRDWANSRGDVFVDSSYECIVDSVLASKDETIVIVSIQALVSAFEEVPVLDARIVFSTRRGFIGSYYISDSRPGIIINRRGDILDKKINYDSFEFMSIH